MNKLTAEKCREQFEEWFKGVEIELRKRGLGFSAVAEVWADMRKAWHASREALEIALPILEQQERGEGEWIEWKGGEQPVDDYAVVEVRFRNGSVEEGERAECYEWNHGYHDLSTTWVDIIAYRIIPERATNQNGEQ